MRYLSRRTGNTVRGTRGNVVWLADPRASRSRSSTDAVASLKQSVARLAAEIERSGNLRAEIATAVSARRYAAYKYATTLGTHAAERCLVRAQDTHLISLLRFVHAIAATPSADRARNEKRVAPSDPLPTTIRELKASVRHARELSGILSQSQRRG